jgi:hypothetical protein
MISQKTNESRFYFQEFEYADYPDSMYVYCNTTFCKTDDYSSACEPVCNQHQPVKRSVNANVLIDVLSELVISAEDEAIINIKKGKDRQ